MSQTAKTLLFALVLAALSFLGLGWASSIATAAPSVSSTLVISQVYGGAGCGTAGCSTYQNDFIELHNNGGVTVSVNGWSVQYASAAGTLGRSPRCPTRTWHRGNISWYPKVSAPTA